MKNKIKKGKLFEDSAKRLEEIIAQLEDGKVDLNKCISLYEEGINLVTDCTEILKNAELKINKLNLKNNIKNISRDTNE